MFFFLNNYYILVILCTTTLITIRINANYTSNYNEYKCTRIQNNYCFLSNDKDCSQTFVQPSSCIGASSSINKCQLIFDWSFKNDLIEFNLNKFNSRPNEWIGVLFTFDNNKQKSDLIIALLPENKAYKLLNGAITNGSDITIINDDDTNNDNYIFNKSIKQIDLTNYIEIKFARYQLSQCGNVLVYILVGRIANDGSILYDKTNLPEPLGSFCFSLNECNANEKFNEARKTDFMSSLAYTDESDYQIVELQIRNKPIKTAQLKFNHNNITVTTLASTQNTTFLKLESDEPITTVASIIQTTNLYSSLISKYNSTEARQVITETNSFTSSTTSTTTTSTIKSTTTSSSTTTTTVSSITTKTSTYFLNSTFILSTDLIPTTQFMSTSCSISLNEIGMSGVKFQYNYDKTNDRIEFMFQIYKIQNQFRFAIFISKDNGSDSIYLLYGEKISINNNVYNISTNITSLSYDLKSTDSFNSIKYSLPSSYTFNSSSIELRDAYIFKIYYSFNSTNKTDFFTKLSMLTPVQTNQIYFSACSLIPKHSIKFYAELLIGNLDWSDNYNNLTSNKSIDLINNITQLLSETLSMSLYEYEAQKILVSSIEKSFSKKHKRSTSNILVRLNFEVMTPSSNQTTKSNVNSILKSLINGSNSFYISRITITDSNPINDISTSTTPVYVQSDYPAQLALALSLALIATIIVLGGGLAGFLYWRKSKFRGPAARSAHTNPFLRVFGDRFSSNRYRSPPAVRLDGLPPNNYANDEFELNQYENHTFDSTDGNKTEQNFTDFTGSREVGIDIGDLIDAENSFANRLSHLSQTCLNETNEDGSSKLKPTGIITTPLSTANHRTSKRSMSDINLEQLKEENEEGIVEIIKNREDVSKIQIKSTNPFYIHEKEQIDNEMTRDDFDKFLDTRFSELLEDKNIQELLTPNKKVVTESTLTNKQEPDSLSESSGNEAEEESNIYEQDDEDAESELNNIFNKDTIEKNLPELFGDFETNFKSNLTDLQLKNTNENVDDRVKSDLIQGNNSSRVSAPLGFASKSNFDQESDSLSTSSIVSADLNDKEINWPTNQLNENLNHQQQINTRNCNDDLSLKSEDLDDYKAIDTNAFKNLRVQANNFILNDPKQINTLKDLLDERKLNENKSNKFADDFIITELPKPRICLVKVNKSFDGLGIHLCGTKNHMIKNIEPNSPADLGGLKPGDKILVINNENVEEASYTTVVNRLKEALLNQTDINLVVMNVIEYNMFKEKNPALENLKIKTDEKDIESKRSSLDKSISNESDTNEIASNEDELKIKKSIFDFDDTKFKMENFVNAEFNPFHDVPNEMFSPFLHYASIPPPPANFQVNDAETEDDYFHSNATPDPFQLNLSSSNIKNHLNDDSNSDLSDNSINSLHNRNVGFKFTDFNSTKNENTSNKQQLNEFEDNFMKSFKPSDETNKVYKKATPINPTDFAMWNSSTSEYSDNGNDLIDNEIISQVSTPKIRDRF